MLKKIADDDDKSREKEREKETNLTKWAGCREKLVRNEKNTLHFNSLEQLEVDLADNSIKMTAFHKCHVKSAHHRKLF